MPATVIPASCVATPTLITDLFTEVMGTDMSTASVARTIDKQNYVPCIPNELNIVLQDFSL